MIRVKLPWGGISPDQMDAFASAIEQFAPLNKGHITTRQNIQVHHVPLRDAASFIREISESGLSSREGCGNTVRNVTADPWAGVCADELFDTTPYAGAYVRYFVRHPTTQLMPRKVKTAFTAPDTDRALTGIHDIAFIARERDGVKGFELRVGGGTSIMPRVAPTLNEFVTADDGEYLKWAEAVFRIFDRQDWLRVNRARARLKVLVDKVGIDEVRRMVDEELEGDWVAERDFSIEDRVFLYDEQADAPGGAAHLRLAQRRRRRVRALPRGQRRAAAPGGLLDRPGQGHPRRPHAGAVPRPRGRSCASSAAATPARPCTRTSCCAGCATRRSTTSGSACSALGLGDAGADQVNDVVSCPGTDSCKLGITSSMGLNRAVQERIESMDITDPLTRKIHIKMSGCPNGCSQHHIGNIGFYGASIKVGEHTIPAYVAHIGGNYEGGEIVYGARLKVRLASKRVPEAVERWIRFYEAERYNESEVFNAFAERVGTDGLRGPGPRPRDADRVRPGDDGELHRLDARTSRSRSCAARANARCRAEPAPRAARGGGDPHHPRGRGRAREAGPALQRRQGLDRAAGAGREGVRAGAAAVRGHARGHGPQLPRGDRVPRPARAGRDRGLACRSRSTRAAWSRRPARAPRATGCRPTTLLDAIAEHGFDAAFGGARRDEERARAKERVFSFRDDFGQWDPRKQRPELWDLYNGRVRRGEHVRVFPLSNWTELDVWEYILAEELEIPGLYVAHEREVFERDGMLYAVSDFVERMDGEEPFTEWVRYRTVGDMTCTGAVRSRATSLEDVVAEIAATRVTERGETRADDRVSEAAMEDRKRVGYF